MRTRDPHSSRDAGLARAIAAVTCALALLAGRAALGAPERAESMAIETFSAYPVGAFPKGWKVRGSMRDAQAIYRIAEESGGRFLAARADRQSIMIGLERPFEPSRYPYLRWRWRVRQCPTGADERRKSTNDSAAGVYVVFPGRFFVPRVLKYVWSSALPIGTRQASPVTSSTKIIVLESGTAGEPAWRTVTVNVQRDYAALFGEPAPTARGIGILTDSNDTSSVAAADYADFQLLGAEGLPAGTARTHTPGAPPTTR